MTKVMWHAVNNIESNRKLVYGKSSNTSVSRERSKNRTPLMFGQMLGPNYTDSITNTQEHIFLRENFSFS